MSSAPAAGAPAQAAPTLSQAGRACLGVGIGLSVLAIGTVGALLWFFARLVDVNPLEASVTVPGAFLLSHREVDSVSLLIAVPGVLLLLATIAFFFFVLLRRSTELGVATLSMWAGGSVTAQLKPLSTGYHLAWIAVAVAGWLTLIVLPVVLAVGGGWPAMLEEKPATYTYLTLGMYGGLSAALALVLTVSLAKKTGYRATIRRRGAAALGGGAGRSFWRWFTLRWRFDLWLAGVGGAFLGTCWMALIFDDTGFFVTAIGLGLAFTAAGLFAALQYWRAGEPIGAGESFA